MAARSNMLESVTVMPRSASTIRTVNPTSEHDRLTGHGLHRRGPKLFVEPLGEDIVLYASHGLMTDTPATSKGAVSRVATIIRFATAVAAMNPSALPMANPADRALAIRSA